MSINSLGSLFYQPLLPHVEVVEEEIIHQWDVNDFVVYLIKKQDALGKNILEYKTIKNQMEIHTENIEIPESKSLERMISQLKTCKIMLDENGMATFSRSYHTWENTSNLNAECEYYDAEINLIRGPKGLVWNVFQKITKENSFHRLKEATIPSLQCHPKIIALIEKIKTEALRNPLLLHRLINDFNVRVINTSTLLEEYKKQLYESYKSFDEAKFEQVETRLNSQFAKRGFNIETINACLGNGAFTAIEIVTHASQALSLTNNHSSVFHKKIISLKNSVELLLLKIHNPLLIEIEPISAPSVIDERMRVSKFTWAVTLVTHQGSNGNHAEIIIEGINDGFYDQDAPRIGAAQKVGIGEKFIHLADYSPQIQSGLLSPDDLKYETRSEIWMVSIDMVKKMLEAIEKEKYLPANQRRPFNLWGIDSKIYKYTPSLKNPFSFSGKVGDNCFTWARDKLKIIDIDLGEGYLDFVIAMAKNYTRNKEEYKTMPIQEMI